MTERHKTTKKDNAGQRFMDKDKLCSGYTHGGNIFTLENIHAGFNGCWSCDKCLECCFNLPPDGMLNA